jgi:hypothetical protein
VKIHKQTFPEAEQVKKVEIWQLEKKTFKQRRGRDCKTASWWIDELINRYLYIEKIEA